MQAAAQHIGILADAAGAHPCHVAKALLTSDVPQLQPDDIAVLAADDLQREVGPCIDCEPEASVFALRP